jgi:hypothetical protein
LSGHTAMATLRNGLASSSGAGFPAGQRRIGARGCARFVVTAGIRSEWQELMFAAA